MPASVIDMTMHTCMYVHSSDLRGTSAACDADPSCRLQDGCILNSNMVASVRPQTTHGQQLEHLFCYDAEHPGCLGRIPAAQVLLEYTAEFMTTYKEAGIPWAAFAHFVDSHEDSSEGAQALDKQLSIFLGELDENLKEDTIVVVTSDHGLHYGPYFTTEAGRRERAQPVLKMRLPRLTKCGGYFLPARNKRQRVTPFDLHETLAELLGTSRGASRYGMSLLHALPQERSCVDSGIPPSICADTAPRVVGGPKGACVPLPTVPSVFSFYQDIMPKHKPSIHCVDKLNPRSRLVAQPQGGAVVRMQEKRASGLNCSCASERRPWRPCLLGASPAADHPGLVDVMNVTKEDTFALVKCGEKSTLAKGFDIHHRSVTLDLSPEKPRAGAGDARSCKSSKHVLLPGGPSGARRRPGGGAELTD